MDKRRAQVGFWCVPIVLDQRMIPQQALDPCPLHALPAPMYQSDLAETGIVRGAQVFVDDRENVARRKCMQVDAVLNRDDKAVFLIRH